jgi:hypothetical protein
MIIGAQRDAAPCSTKRDPLFYVLYAAGEPGPRTHRGLDNVIWPSRHPRFVLIHSPPAEEEPNVFDAIYRARLCPLYG